LGVKDVRRGKYFIETKGPDDEDSIAIFGGLVDLETAVLYTLLGRLLPSYGFCVDSMVI